MNITLPPRTGGTSPEIDISSARHIVVIGANGSGKTRFANRLAADLGKNAMRLSALKALYVKDNEDPTTGSIDHTYHNIISEGSLLRADLRGEFDRLIGILLNEEMLSLLADKFDPKEKKPRTTRLERVMGHWKHLFPDNHVLIESGKMIFSRDDAPDSYGATKLSDGEKAVMYYLGAAALAPTDSVIIVDSPTRFLHPTTNKALWERIERWRRDCTFIYITHDLQFASSRSEGVMLWVKNCDLQRGEWDYEFITSPDVLDDEIYLAILGERKPVLFIEGDGKNSIDGRLYPLIFNDYTVKSLGGCDRVIESTRTFNSLKALHNLNASGIVDRDRRDEGEVGYLRKKQILVPEVAEVENIFMVEDVIRTVARVNNRNPDEAFAKVKRTVMKLFEGELRQQALQHTRHRVKRGVEHRIDGRFTNIAQLENHISDLTREINPRGIYEELYREFRRYVRDEDYASVLKVYNRKTMISESHVARLCGLKKDDKDSMIRAVLDILRRDLEGAAELRKAVREVFR